ncbi:VOC family protein [Indiicoccus explosivorum]|uniref:VOC family protein n=1 Tax=Indiicoccus explosivorum TaxID=1917864 RepID=UPI000B451F4D|nr:VOC family protein [Indiicoccus explosivorum]
MFKKVELYTSKLEDMKKFYTDLLGFPVREASADRFSVAIGSSELVFLESGTPSIYHFAFNIPGDSYSSAKEWAAQRVRLNREGESDEVYYERFDADAFYFDDPSGNVVELIARRQVRGGTEFNPAELQDISEVSITTDHVKTAAEALLANGIPQRTGDTLNPEGLNFFGKENAYVLLVPPGRTWYFSDKTSAVRPLSILFTDGKKADVSAEGNVTVFTEGSSADGA